MNTSKTKIVIFSRGKVRRYPDFVFGTEKLDIADAYVYLGVKFKNRVLGPRWFEKRGPQNKNGVPT